MPNVGGHWIFGLYYLQMICVYVNCPMYGIKVVVSRLERCFSTFKIETTECQERSSNKQIFVAVLTSLSGSRRTTLLNCILTEKNHAQPN